MLTALLLSMKIILRLGSLHSCVDVKPKSVQYLKSYVKANKWETKKSLKKGGWSIGALRCFYAPPIYTVHTQCPNRPETNSEKPPITQLPLARGLCDTRASAFVYCVCVCVG